MLIKAEQKYVRMSPRKLRLVADTIRGIKEPGRAVSLLEGVEKRAALPLSKTIKQAIANASKNLGLAENSLRIKELQVQDGPTYKRFKPVSRGRIHSLQKRTSHIRVILETEDKVTRNSLTRDSKEKQRVTKLRANESPTERRKSGTES